MITTEEEVSTTPTVIYEQKVNLEAYDAILSTHEGVFRVLDKPHTSAYLTRTEVPTQSSNYTPSLEIDRLTCADSEGLTGNNINHWASPKHTPEPLGDVLHDHDPLHDHESPKDEEPPKTKEVSFHKQAKSMETNELLIHSDYEHCDMIKAPGIEHQDIEAPSTEAPSTEHRGIKRRSSSGHL
ncbi:unnamed protein product [Cochlearia groenlandica]